MKNIIKNIIFDNETGKSVEKKKENLKVIIFEHCKPKIEALKTEDYHFLTGSHPANVERRKMLDACFNLLTTFYNN